MLRLLRLPCLYILYYLGVALLSIRLEMSVMSSILSSLLLPLPLRLPTLLLHEGEEEEGKDGEEEEGE